MKPISTFAHGVVDYIVGILLLFAPQLFDFSDLSENAILFSRLFGVLIIGLALITNYELGVIRAISMRTHLSIDYVLGVLMAVSPWIFRFSDDRNATVVFLVIGLAGLGIAALTRSTPLRAHTV